MAEADVLPFEGVDEHILLTRAGEKLRAARERLGLNRTELSLRTKINERHLAALEDGDFSALPARIYAVGFAKSYAGAVGLDGGTIAAEVRRELNRDEAPAAVRPAYDLDLEDPAKVPSRGLAWLAAALGIAVIAAGAVFWRSYFVPAVDLPPVRIAAPDLTPAAMVSPTAESAVPAAAPVEAEPVDVAPAEAAPRRDAASAAPAASGVQSLPSPVPERLVPLPQATSAAPASAPAT